MGKSEVKTINYYDGISRGYKNLYHDEQIKKISLVKSYLPTNGNLLDLGCGDGVLNQFISESVNLVSLDISSELLKINSNPYLKIHGSILNLPIKDKSIEFLCSFSVFQDLSDVSKGVSEVKRVLSSGGVGIISFLKVSSKFDELCSLIEENFEVMKRIEDDVKDIIFVFKQK